MTKCTYLDAKYGFNLGHTIGMVVCDSETESSLDYDYYELDDYSTQSSLRVDTLSFLFKFQSNEILKSLFRKKYRPLNFASINGYFVNIVNISNCAVVNYSRFIHANCQTR